MRIDELKIARLENSLREGEARMRNPKTRNAGVERSVADTKIRISRLRAGLDEGLMMWDESQNRWRYEHE